MDDTDDTTIGHPERRTNMEQNKTKNRQRNSSTYFVEDVLYHFTEWLKRLWIIILVLAMLGTVAISFYTYKTFTPVYQASATFTVNVDIKESSSQSYNKATANQLAKTFPNILTSSSLNKVICADLGVGYISSNISASVIEDTNLFTITVTSPQAQEAYDVLQSVINNYPKIAKFVIGSTQLTLIDSSAVSTMPINMPNYTKKAMLGAGAGGAVGLAIIVLLALTTTTIIRADDISNYYNLSCLGSIAELSHKKRSSQKAVENPNVLNPNINYKFREGMYSLRNSVIRKCRDNGYKSIIVTSTISGEGKSVIALNLAKSIALKGYKTCLVDFDLRVPSISNYLNIENEINSISDYINENADFQSCVYSTEQENFFIAVERKNNAEASEMVGSDRAKELIQNLTKAFEFVIIDTPPTGYLADASVIGDYTDACIYVVAQDLVSRRAIGDGLTTLDNVKANVIGCVLNRITKGAESINYERYSYRRYMKYGKYSKYYNRYSNGTTNTTVESNINGVEFED